MLTNLPPFWQWSNPVKIYAYGDTKIYRRSIKPKLYVFGNWCDELSKYGASTSLSHMLLFIHSIYKVKHSQAVWRFFSMDPSYLPRCYSTLLRSVQAPVTNKWHVLLRHYDMVHPTKRCKKSHEYWTNHLLRGMSSISCHVSIPCSFETTLRLTRLNQLISTLRWEFSHSFYYSIANQ